MSPTIRLKYKYFHSIVQRVKDRRQKFHFFRLPFDVRPRITSSLISLITKSDGDREAGFRFLNHEYDYRLNWTIGWPVTN